MQGGFRGILSHGKVVKSAILQKICTVNSPQLHSVVFTRFKFSAAPSRMEEHGFESTTISNILEAKGKSADGSWLWCTMNDSVYDAVQSMTQHNVGALVVVKPDKHMSIVGIITERGTLLV
ncbi:hypothetical protein PIB30_075314 [Stylosanthes scabra]|uniref:CBS domain-containing protein n=1 Tax=Stylosanthes scabra TaxID=79078 RepID=A0ABU6WN99_9FABA|nr:hypothetical protein [Stylosanthes scabra]